MEPTAIPLSVKPAKLTGVTFVAVYVDDYVRAFEFYNDLLGIEKSFDMGPTSCYMSITSEVGLYLEGGNVRSEELSTNTARASFGLTAESVTAMHAKLRDAGVRLVHDAAPQDMGGGHMWFQCYDPSGNLIEIVGRA